MTFLPDLLASHPDCVPSGIGDNNARLKAEDALQDVMHRLV